MRKGRKNFLSVAILATALCLSLVSSSALAEEAAFVTSFSGSSESVKFEQSKKYKTRAKLYAAENSGITIDESHFPDENFRVSVSNYDSNHDNMLSADEIAEVKELYVYSKSICSLDGIEYFSGLTYLNCNGNHLTILDVRKNTALKNLSCSNNQLTSLDVSENTALKNLYCDNNQLTNLDVSKNTALTNLSCGGNQLTNLDVNKNTALLLLSCGFNQLTSMDVSKNTALKTLECVYNQLTSLNVGNTALEELTCSQNPLTNLDISENTPLKSLNCSECQLTSLNVNQITGLKELNCYNNQLTSLNVSKNTALTSLICENNQLTSLDVSKNTALTTLRCENNHLTSLDVSRNTTLEVLQCTKNQLTSLDVSKNPALAKLACYHNQLTSLNFSTCPNLVYIYQNGNHGKSDHYFYYYGDRYIEETGHSLGCHLSFDESVTLTGVTIRKYSIGIDTWSFRNKETGPLPFKYFKKFFPPFIAEAQYSMHKGGFGSCYGMSALAPCIMEYGFPFDAYKKHIHDYEYSEVKQWIDLMQLFQLSADRQIVELQNKGKLNKLYEAVKSEMYNRGEPVVISLTDHEVLVTSLIKDTPGEVIIGIYDPSIPDNKFNDGKVTGYSSLRLSGIDGNYTKCTWEVSAKEGGDPDPNNPPVDITDRISFDDNYCKNFMVYMVGNEETGMLYGLLSIPVYFDYTVLTNSLSNAVNVIPVTVRGGDSNSSETSLYWIDSDDDTLNIPNVKAGSEIKLALSSKCISIIPERNSDITIKMSDNLEDTELSVSSVGTNIVHCEYQEVQEDDKVIQTELSLQGEKAVSLKLNKEKIISNGVTGLDAEQVKGSFDDENGELKGEKIFSVSDVKIVANTEYVLNISQDMTGNIDDTSTGTGEDNSGPVSDDSPSSGETANLISQTTVKAANPMTVKTKTIKVKYKKLKKKKQKFAVKKGFTVKKAQGKVTYKVTKYDKKAKKKINVSKTGKITVKKGLKKGTYKLKVKVMAAGNANYKAATKTVTLKVKIK